MKKLFYAILTLTLGLVLSSGSCSTDAIDPDGVMIDGIVWAKYNVGAPGTFAATPESAGMYYQWNHKIGWAGSGSITGWDNTPLTGPTWVAANDPCPTDWRVPSKAEFDKLIAFAQPWDETKKGRYFGSGANSIFLPAAGGLYSVSNTLDSFGSTGSYWTNEMLHGSLGRSMDFTSSYIPAADDESGAGNSWGFSVRCVKKP